MMTKSTLLFCFLTLLSVPLHRTSGDDILKALNGLANSVCSAIIGTVSTAPCAKDFYVTLSAPMTKISTQDEQLDKDLENIRGNFKYCCAVAALKSCIITAIKKDCGDKAESESRKVVSSIARLQDDTCSGDELVYQYGSPLCWNESAQYAGLIIVGLLLLSCCCCCVVKMCRK